MLTINSKIVLSFCYNPRIEDKTQLSNIWTPILSYSSDLYGIMSNSTNINAKLISKKSNLVSSGILYFGKTSKFPRFKLQDTSYKRCIKVEKADNIVLGSITLCKEFLNCILYQDEIYVYMINFTRCGKSIGSPNAVSEFKNNPIQYIIDNNLFYGSEFKLLYKGDLSVYNKDNYFDVVNIMNNIYNNIVTDDMLDNAINKNLENITREDLISIEDMLDSQDSSTQNIGLKMLCGYNVSEVPLTLRFILSMRDYLTHTSAWTSVGVKQVLKSIDFTTFQSIQYFNINPDIVNSTTDLDKELFTEVYTRELKKYINNKLLVYLVDKLAALNLKFTYEIK